MPDLNALLIFSAVAEAKSFSEASRRLGKPVSTVSRRVAELEDQLGVRLLERSTRSLRLTDVGAEVLDYAQQTVEVSDAVESLVSNRLTGSDRSSPIVVSTKHCRLAHRPADKCLPGVLSRRSSPRDGHRPLRRPHL